MAKKENKQIIFTDETAKIALKEIEKTIIEKGFKSFCIFTASDTPNNSKTLDIRIVASMDADNLVRSVILLLKSDERIKEEFAKQSMLEFQKEIEGFRNFQIDPEMEFLTKSVKF